MNDALRVCLLVANRNRWTGVAALSGSAAEATSRARCDIPMRAGLLRRLGREGEAVDAAALRRRNYFRHFLIMHVGIRFQPHCALWLAAQPLGQNVGTRRGRTPLG